MKCLARCGSWIGRLLAGIILLLQLQQAQATCTVPDLPDEQLADYNDLHSPSREYALYPLVLDVWPKEAGAPPKRELILADVILAAGEDIETLETRLVANIGKFCVDVPAASAAPAVAKAVASEEMADAGDDGAGFLQEYTSTCRSLWLANQGVKSAAEGKRVDTAADEAAIAEWCEIAPLAAGHAPSWESSCSIADLRPSIGTATSALNAMQECRRAAEGGVDKVLRTLTKDQNDEVAMKRAAKLGVALHEIQNRQIEMAAHSGIYTGPRFTLQDDGSFAGGVEVLAAFNQNAYDYTTGLWGAATCPGFMFSWCRLFVEFGYVKANLDEEEAAVGYNPLAAKDGAVRINFGYRTNVNDAFGFALGLGAVAPVEGTESDGVGLELRQFAGVQSESIYNGAAGGEARGFGKFFLGVAHDSSWKVCRERAAALEGETVGECSDSENAHGRYVLDARYVIPGTSLGSFKLAARVYADMPIKGEGESEVGLSIMLFQDINEWLSSNSGAK